MKQRGKKVFIAVAAVACFIISGLAAQAGQGPSPVEQKQAPIPFNRLGVEVDQRTGGKDAGPVATVHGFRLASKMQALEAEIASGGITVKSLSKTEGGGFFSITPIAVNGVQANKGMSPVVKKAADGTVLLDRGFIQERFSTSADGIRQDFIIASPPRSPAEDLVVSLAISGAKAGHCKKDTGSVLLTLASGRKLVYHRLHVTDAYGRVLQGRMSVRNPAEVKFIVAAKNAAYPITIDPTITDADWVSMNSGMDKEVYALAFDTSGNLYAGGRFTTAGGIPANHIAKWDGASWSALGPGMDSIVRALSFDAAGNLYAGGYLTTAGGVTANGIAKWDGASWSALGSGMNGHVLALAVDASGNLYVGGGFTKVGGITASNIAKWDGATWSALGSGVGADEYSAVLSLALDASGNLYVGGRFTKAGGITVNGIAKWDGREWSALGLGMYGAWDYTYGYPSYIHPLVLALAFDPTGKLYAGGRFTTAGGVSANSIAKWNGRLWSGLGLVIGREYNEKPQLPWINALAVDASGNLYAGGAIGRAGGVMVNDIAKWNGWSWSGLGSGMNRIVSALAVDVSGNLYAGGEFTTAGDKDSPYIAKCNLPSTTTTIGCPATQMLGADNPNLASLRDFRDSKLANSFWGQKIIEIYYNNAAGINAALDRSPELRACARRMLETIAPMVGK